MNNVPGMICFQTIFASHLIHQIKLTYQTILNQHRLLEWPYDSRFSILVKKIFDFNDSYKVNSFPTDLFALVPNRGSL